MYEGRVEFVSKSLEQLQETITRKEDNMRVVRDISMVVSRTDMVQRDWEIRSTHIDRFVSSSIENATTATAAAQSRRRKGSSQGIEGFSAKKTCISIPPHSLLS